MKFKTAPWDHQLKELKDHWYKPARALLWQMRTGKTKVIVDTLGLWHAQKGLRTAFIVAPNGVHYNWVLRELPLHAWYQYQPYAWENRSLKTFATGLAFDDLVFADGLAVLAIGKEALSTPKAQWAIKKLLTRGPAALIVDESHHCGKPSTKVTRSAIRLARSCVMRRILTGTPIGNSPMRLYSQFEILEKDALGYQRFKQFQRRYAKFRQSRFKGRIFQQIVGYQRLKELKARMMQWSTVIKRDDCGDMPPLLFVRHLYTPSSEQLRVYRDLKKLFIAELLSGDEVEALDPAPRLVRLQQVLSNHLPVDEEIQTVDSSSDPRLEALLTLVDGPTIVWCRFREDVRRVLAAVRGNGLTAAEVHGDIPGRVRHNNIALFQSGQADLVVGNPAAAAEGVDLSRADTIVWYSHTFDVVMRDQANERATRKGGKPVSIVDIEAKGTVDTHILDNLQRKHDVSEYMTRDHIRQLLEKV